MRIASRPLLAVCLGAAIGVLSVLPFTGAEAGHCPFQSVELGPNNDIFVASDDVYNLVQAEAGHDHVRGADCADDLYGSFGADELKGNSNAQFEDYLRGEEGSDKGTICTEDYCGGLHGGAGDDDLGGGGDDDWLEDILDNYDTDDLKGSYGADKLQTDDGDTDDTVQGHDGNDECYFDGPPPVGTDTHLGCEEEYVY